MLDPKLHDKLNQAYAKLGEIGYKISLNIKGGKDFTTRQQELWAKGLRIWILLKTLFRHVDTSTTPPTLNGITELQVNEIIKCLDKIGDYDRLPIIPKLFPCCKPYTINTGGGSGTQGPQGPAGSDANINLVLKNGEYQLELQQSVVGGVKTYTLGFTTYKPPAVVINFANPQIQRKGQSVDKLITFVSTKGSEPITGMTIFDVILNPLLQAVIDLPTMNGNTQPVSTSIQPNLIDTRLIQVTITDGITPVTVTKNLLFVYPILFGSSSNTSINYYDTLNKLDEDKGTKDLLLNGDVQYFYIATLLYYGDIRIYDHNEIEVTQEFTKSTSLVTSSGLDNNWSINYNIWRTTNKTTINNRLFRIEFID